ncbi:MAG: heavy metal translocating P-type ATPase [Spirochaetales bacterium]|nr:heavy metal translocating P-type ATPase [Spirochaetales bacterium]
MSTASNKELIERVVELEGIGCASCADKIEKNLLRLPGVENARVNFALSRLVLHLDETVTISSVLDSAERIFKEIEPGVRLLTGDGDGKADGHSGETRMRAPSEEDFGVHGSASAGYSTAGRAEGKAPEQDAEHATASAAERAGVRRGPRKWLNLTLLRMVLAVVVFIIPVVFNLSSLGFSLAGLSLKLGAPWLNIMVSLEFLLFLLAYLISGWKVLRAAAGNILKGDFFNEHFLMTIATAGAFVIGKYPEAVAVMLFYTLGEYFQDIAVNNSRRSIKALLAIKPDFAFVIRKGKSFKVKPDEVKPGQTIVVKPGERIALDGIVKEGRSLVDTSALTGESSPRETVKGDEVLSGTINLDGILYIDVARPFGESAVSRILKLVEDASDKKAPTETFITKFSRYYTPFVVFAAVLLAVLPPIFSPFHDYSLWIYRALIFLVISCPCAFVVSIPLGFFSGIGRASRDGVLVKGSNYLEALTDTEIVVFDKTGTLTKGGFTVTEVVPFMGTEDDSDCSAAQGTDARIDRDSLLRTAAIAESFSNHPIACSIVNAYINKMPGGLEDVDFKDCVKNYREISGLGVEGDINERHVLAGKLELLKQNGIKAEEAPQPGTIVYVAVDGKYAGYIALSDMIKDDSAMAVEQLKKLGIKKIVMLTGDRDKVAREVGTRLNIDEVYSELLPYEKVEKIELLEKEKSKGKKLVFVGDGINDAPVLARADVGIAMGGVGSEAAVEAADVVLMTDEPSAIVRGIKTARRTRRIVWQNIALALGIKGFFMMLGALGLATLWEAVFADVGVTIIAVFNALRILKK